MGAHFGSKATSGLCQAIITLMSPHDTCIETHFGGGAIMTRKPRHGVTSTSIAMSGRLSSSRATPRWNWCTAAPINS